MPPAHSADTRVQCTTFTLAAPAQVRACGVITARLAGYRTCSQSQPLSRTTLTAVSRALKDTMR